MKRIKGNRSIKIVKEPISPGDLVRVEFTEGNNKYFGDYTQEQYKLLLLKEKFKQKGISEQDLDDFASLVSNRWFL